jgi:hypothetical protein
VPDNPDLNQRSPSREEDDDEGHESSTDDEVGRQLSEELRASPLENSLESDASQSRDQPFTAVLADLDTTNILTASRRRRPPNNSDFYNHHIAPNEDSLAVLAAFAIALNAPRPQYRFYRDDLPDAPANWKELLKHPFREQFTIAAQEEIDSLKSKGAFKIVPIPNDRSKQILPLKWVFTYKFDENGFLTKVKARICARGDLQRISPEEKRAATLAAKTARAIFALSASYDLDLH